MRSSGNRVVESGEDETSEIGTRVLTTCRLPRSTWRLQEDLAVIRRVLKGTVFNTGNHYVYYAVTLGKQAHFQYLILQPPTNFRRNSLVFRMEQHQVISRR